MNTEEIKQKFARQVMDGAKRWVDLDSKSLEALADSALDFLSGQELDDFIEAVNNGRIEVDLIDGETQQRLEIYFFNSGGWRYTLDEFAL